MSISGILSVSYFVIGFVLAIYWFNKEYAKSYDEAVANNNVEKGMSSISMLGFMIFWPIKLIKNIVKKKRI